MSDNDHVSFRLSGGGEGISLTMPINPDQIQITSPARQTTTQTMGGIYKDILGIGVRSLTIQGSTGWRKSALTGLNGQETAQILWRIYEEYYKRIVTTPEVELLFIDDIDGYSFKITMDDFQTSRNKAEPLIIRYSIPITLLQDMSNPKAPSPDIPVQVALGISSIVAKSTSTVAAVAETIKPDPIPYTVVSGNTLWKIADMFYHDGSQYPLIAQFNNISSPYTIYPGQIILVPYR